MYYGVVSFFSFRNNFEEISMVSTRPELVMLFVVNNYAYHRRVSTLETLRSHT